VRLANVSKRFRDRIALLDLDLEVRRGEIVGLAGPNGAGKTTTLRISAGLLRPDSGSVVVAGGDPRHPATRRRIGFAMQAPAIYERLTVEENLRFFLRLYGWRGAELERRMNDALVMADLQARRRSPTLELSGGMQHRLDLAIATAHRPEVLLLDEPTTGVDASSRSLLRSWLFELERENAAIIVASHDVEELERIADRIVWLERGRSAREMGGAACASPS
jgi:ABC-2 type transport system ATP-binding protein